MPIGDMPILEILVKQIKSAGLEEFILTVGHLAELLRAFFGDGERLGVKIEYSIEEIPLGTAGPLSLISSRLDAPFLVSNGDVLTSLDFSRLIRWHQESGAIATIASKTRQVTIDLGVLETDANHNLTGYTEKPSFNYDVSMGIYVFEPRMLEYIPYNQYLDFPDLVLKLIDSGETVKKYPFEGYWQDLGRQSDYEQAVLDFDDLRDQILPPGN
jgi:NDP-sugar pyrophosphorylase family protein